MLLDRLRIRSKLVVLVVVPLLSMVGLAAPVVTEKALTARQADVLATAVQLASRVGTLVQDVQQEQLLAVGVLLGQATPIDFQQQSAVVDDRVSDLRATWDGSLPPRVAAALDEVRSLAAVRAAVLAEAITPTEILQAFTAVNSGLIDSLRLQVASDGTPVTRKVLALDTLLRADQELSLCGTLLVLVKAAKGKGASADFIACMGAYQVSDHRYRSLIGHEQTVLRRLDETAVAARAKSAFLTAGARDPAGAVRQVPIEQLFPSIRSMITIGQFVEKKLVADVLAEVTAEQRRALATAWLVGGAAALVLLIVLLLSFAVARTVARPLTRLTRSADRVARVAEAELVRVADDETEAGPPVRLDPVDVRARDEIGDLARAFERVQRTAARLVERQVAGRRNVAQMFGHVGRRTQNLVGRQIALIDRLERQEADPGRLEDLYRLDHISSRLRRNAGSLVVLSGSTGSDGHVAPVPLADVVRLALGEIEDFTRVDVQVPPGVSAAPATVGDLVLALAELMENATLFSPPHTRVVVSGELTGTGARLSVVDQGIGMTEERLAEENARLTRRERLDLAPTEVLGLFVVGRLARRHGWTVRLTPTLGGGVTAHLQIPATALMDTPANPPLESLFQVGGPGPTASLGATAGAAVGSQRPIDRAIPAPAAGDRVPELDSTLLRRIIDVLGDGESWNAFVTDRNGRPAGTTGRVNINPQLPDSGAPATYRATAPAPVGTLEPGVRRAEPGPPATDPARSQHAPGQAPLSRRVPGATLAVPPPRPTVSRQPDDPAEVRNRLSEFEAGIARALREVSPTSRNEEETSR